MSATSTNSRQRKWLLGSAALFLVAALAGGAYFWLYSGRSVPVIPLDGQDREVSEKIKESRDAVVKAPRSADAWGRLGCVLLANELFPEIGLVCFTEAERLDPNNPRWPYFSAGYLNVDEGKPQEAVKKLERVVSLLENTGDAPTAPRLLLAETLLSIGQSEQAATHFKKALALEPNNARAQFGLGLIAYGRGNWSSCRTYLEACRGAPQVKKKAHTHLASVCARLGDKENAERYADLAARLTKDFDWIDPYLLENVPLAVRKSLRYRNIDNLVAQGQLVHAVNILFVLIAEYPDDYLPHLTMGKIKGQMAVQSGSGSSGSELASAEEHLLKAKQLAPDKIQVHYLLSLVYFHKGEAVLARKQDALKAKAHYEDSARSARAALAIRSDYGYAHMALGLALKSLGQRADALAAFRQAVHCNPEYADNHLFLGQALAEEKDVEKARYHLEQARLLAGPDDPRAKAALEKLPAKNAPKEKKLIP